MRLAAVAAVSVLWLAGAFASPAQAQRVDIEEPNRGGALDLATQDPEIARQRLRVADGFTIELFASEQEFPIGNPVSLTFDTKGRLWVATMPTYPQRLPDEPPRDRIVILEDTDRDGRADRHTVFADGLHLPAGFELGDGGAYVAQQPDLVFLQDTDGDDRADRRETVLHGFGTEDSHHAISAFTWGPEGALYFQEGTFHHSQVETPWGPVRLVDAGVFRYEPQRHWLEVFVSYPFANPWGHVFDRWGQNFIADASGGANYFGTAITGNAPYPQKRKPMKVFTSIVRPTSGVEIVTSRHFPPESQGNFLVNNVIGFQGIKQHRMIEEGSGFTSEEVEPLVYSTDINFRPVDLQFGPDGALYVVDWFNPLIGHMQYSFRDPRRDSGHGRIWRIRHESRPLIEPVDLSAATVEELLGHLEAYEDRARYRARIELRSRDRDEVLAAIPGWLAREPLPGPSRGEVGDATVLSPVEHKKLEALWLHQARGEVDEELLEQVLASPEPRARAAATRVLRFWRHRFEDSEQRLAAMLDDPFARVRVEALLGLSYHETASAASAALAVLDSPRDYYLDYVLGETLDTLRSWWLPGLESGDLLSSLPDDRLQYLLSRLDTETLVRLRRDPAVLRAIMLRRDMDEAVAELALEEYLAATSGTSQAARLLDLIEEADARSLQGAVPLFGSALVGRPAGEIAELLSSIETLESRGAQDETLTWLVAARMSAADVPLDLLEESASFNEVMRRVEAVTLTPADVRQRYFGEVERLSRSVPESVVAQLSRPVDSIRLSLGERTRLQVLEVDLGGAPPDDPTARQSSTASDELAPRAIDGDLRTSTTTATEEGPWLEVSWADAQPLPRAAVYLRSPRAAGGLEVEASRGGEALYRLRGFRAGEDGRILVDPAAALRARAVVALAAMPDRREDMLTTLLDLLDEPALASRALDGLSSASPDETIAAARELGREPELVAGLADGIDSLPLGDLTASNVRAWFALGHAVVAADIGDTARLERVLEVRAAARITLRPVPHQMVFDTLEFSVEASRPLEIRFENLDVMPHNVVVTQPGGLEDVGEMAEQLARTDPARAERLGYVPIAFSSLIVEATPLVLPGDTAAIAFLAPSRPGRYPFVCTFPGHWILMNGTMNVVPSGDAVPPPVMRELTQEQMTRTRRDFVEDWTIERLRPVVEESAQGPWATRAQIDVGRELFGAVGCDRCHRKEERGGEIGPSLEDLADRYDPVETLRHILDPSALVEEEYETILVETSDGRFYSGLEESGDTTSLSIRADPLDPERVITIPVADIVDRSKSPLSPMPEGLLVTLTEEEILNLLRYVRNKR